jgi:hypothetical protein
VATRNDALATIIKTCPEKRKSDLVFYGQNGYIEDFLKEQVEVCVRVARLECLRLLLLMCSHCTLRISSRSRCQCVCVCVEVCVRVLQDSSAYASSY